MGKKSFRLRVYLMTMTALMLLIALVPMVWVTHQAMRETQAIARQHLVAQLGSLTLRASAEAARERGWAVLLLSSPQHASADNVQLTVLRSNVDALHGEIVQLMDTLLRQLPDSFPHIHAQTLKNRYAQLLALRGRIDSTLAGKPQQVSLEAWRNGVNQYIDMLAHLRREGFTLPDTQGQSLGQQIYLLENIHLAAEYAGRERALVTAVLGAGRSFHPAEQAELERYRLYVETAVATLEDVTSHSGEKSIREEFIRLQNTLFGSYERTRQSIYRASREQTAYPLSGIAWFQEVSQAIDAMSGLAQTVNRLSQSKLAQAEYRANQIFLLIALAAVALAGLMIMIYLGLRDRMLEPIEELVVATQALARGHLDTPIQPLRNDEIGILARAFDSMRLALQSDREMIRSAEDALRSQEQRLRNILDNASEAVISINQDQQIILFNKAAEAIFGYGQEVLGKPLDILLPEAARAAHGAHVRQFAMAADNMRMSGETKGQRRDGSLFPAEASISKLDSSGGAIFTVILRDITARQNAEAMQRRLLAIIKSTPDLVGTSDVQGRITFLNQAGRRLLGLDDEQSTEGLHVSRFLAPWSVAQYNTEARAYALRDGFWQGDSALRGQDGKERPVSHLILLHRDTQGQSFLSFSMRDISELEQAQQELGSRNADLLEAYKELEQTQTQLLQSEKMASIGQLAAGVAHEINNPVGYVSSNLGTMQVYVNDLFQLLASYEKTDAWLAAVPELRAEIEAIRQKIDLAYLREDMQNLVRESQDGLSRVKKIVQDLKEFSHVGSAEWQETDLHLGLDSTLNIVHNEIKYKAEVVREYGQLPPVECLPAQINQVFMNLLVNAAQAIETHGTISIRTGTEADGVFVEIRDNGKGMPPDVQKRIFEPFFTTKPVGKGTGLGLSLSYNIIKKHQGRLEVSSAPGQGSTFRLWLPQHRVSSEELEQQRKVGT